MTADSPSSDHGPLLYLHGEGGRAALPRLFAHVDDEDGFIELLDRALAAGGVVALERDGDWLILPG
jgi:hypothetical protein